MSWTEIKEQVEANGNVRTFTMDVLRNAHGAGKLGVNVRAEISQALAGIGLGHVGTSKNLPNAGIIAL